MEKKAIDKLKKTLDQVNDQIRERREAQLGIILTIIRDILNKYGCNHITLILEIEYGTEFGVKCVAEGSYRTVVDNKKAFDEIQELLDDYPEVFMGCYGEATIMWNDTKLIFDNK